MEKLYVVSIYEEFENREQILQLITVLIGAAIIFGTVATLILLGAE